MELLKAGNLDEVLAISENTSKGYYQPSMLYVENPFTGLDPIGWDCWDSISEPFPNGSYETALLIAIYLTLNEMPCKFVSLIEVDYLTVRRTNFQNLALLVAKLG